jgi:hypothetical protein
VFVSDAIDPLPSPERLAYLISGNLQSHDLGLWEIVRTLNSLAPDAALADKIRLARRTLPLLVGHYDLWRGERPSGPVALLTEREKQVLAHDDAPWHDPDHAELLVWLRDEGQRPSP